MLSFSAKIFAIVVFLVVAGFVGLVLWQSLFPSKHPKNNEAATEQQYTQQDSTKEESKISADKTAIDDKIATYTLALAVFTALLVLVSAFQIGFLINAEKIANISAKAAKDSADAAKQSADAAVTVAQPNLFVTNPKLVADHFFGPDQDRMPKITFDITNYGGSPAILRWYVTHVYAHGKDFSGGPFNGWEVIKPGETKEGTYGNKFPIGGAFKDLSYPSFWVEINYFDIFGYLHTSGFTFFFKPNVSEPGFTAIAGEKYNYHRVEKIPQGQWKPKITYPASDVWKPPQKPPAQDAGQ